ncbi:MAG: protoheme IX farnesyltransferase [Luteitalea sp.]|nr:protoheme IX farnesyltransferase [Luteitalea sp.]
MRILGLSKSGVLASAPAQGRAADYLELAKPRLNLLVIATTAAAYCLGARGAIEMAPLLHTIVGTALVAGGASAFNMLLERDVDALMARTRNRPLPAGRIGVVEAGAFAAAISAMGLVQLALFVNGLAAGIALATHLSYVLVYTPLKSRTSLATVVGAVPGALPALIGWAAATNSLSREGWLLFAIVFLWQMPHFLAIAWLCRDEYARAGFAVLPVAEPDGRSTARQTVAYAAALFPVSLTPSLAGLSGPMYFATALVLSALFLWLSLRFARRRTRSEARRLFLASILYLPLLCGVLVVDGLLQL